VRVAPTAFRKLDLEAHTFLADVPLEDVSAVDLAGGGEGRGVADLRSLLASLDLRAAGRATRFLFALRTLLGRVFDWDRDVELPAESYIHRLTPAQRARSSVVPGTPERGFRVVYVFENEALSEIINATVHAFLCSALVSSASGYRLYWAVYVKPVSRWTSLYMAAIEPFRRFIVYPSILRRIERAWAAKYGTT
jgi:Protein of unknown function (DUF2867)